MRAAPPFQVSLQHFGAWRAALLALGLAGGAALLAWWTTREAWHTLPATIALGAAAAAVLGGSAWLARVRAASLRWDGQRWYLAPVGTAGGDTATPGELRVMIDLGPWMLLRFVPAAGATQPRPVWLPVQRRGLEAQWHALRCAVHAPQPAPEADRTVEP